MRNKAAKWVFEALEHVTAVFPFPILGIDSENGSEFITDYLLPHQKLLFKQRYGAKVTKKLDAPATPG